jgi:hypothetical protein
LSASIQERAGRKSLSRRRGVSIHPDVLALFHHHQRIFRMAGKREQKTGGKR